MIARLWWLLVAFMLSAIAGWLDAQPRTVTLAIGRFGGTDQEIQECYFSVNRAMLILDPRGDMCAVARDLIGKTGTLMFIVD